MNDTQQTRTRTPIDREALHAVQQYWGSRFEAVFDQIHDQMLDGATDSSRAVQVATTYGFKPGYRDTERTAKANLLQLVGGISQWMDTGRGANVVVMVGMIVQFGPSKKDASRNSGTIVGRVGDQKLRCWFLEPENSPIHLEKNALVIIVAPAYRVSRDKDNTIFSMMAQVEQIYRLPQELAEPFLPMSGSNQQRLKTGGACPWCEGELHAQSPGHMWCPKCTEQKPRDSHSETLPSNMKGEGGDDSSSSLSVPRMKRRRSGGGSKVKRRRTIKVTKRDA